MITKKPPYWNKAIRDLMGKDKILAKIIANHKREYLISRESYFISLTRAVIGQQISVKAAQSIWINFLNKYKRITPENISKVRIAALKNIGLSKQKSSYIKNIAIFFIKNQKRIRTWHKLEDEVIIQDLVSIKGIGPWTAEMFLMFSLGRANIFPSQDLGFLKAISINYGKKLPISKSFLNKLKRKWNPWCSVATWYMWRSIDPIPVNY